MESPSVENVRRMARRTVESEPVQRTLEMTETVGPWSIPLVVGGSILVSAALFFSGRKWESLFVGLWAPTLLTAGLFYRLLVSREMHREFQR